MSVTGGPRTGADGRRRCPWPGDDPQYLAYHDEEWGRPTGDERALFEKLSLEAFQAGLSWLTILRRREGFRAAFDGFDPVVIAAYDTVDRDRLLADTRIVRNRAKVEATIANAHALLAMHTDGETLARLVWSHMRAPAEPPVTMADVPARTPESGALAAVLKARGLRFVGPTTCYALMQATGVVDDHLADCWVRQRPDTPPCPR